MAENLRPEKDGEAYWIQPADGVTFVERIRIRKRKDQWSVVNGDELLRVFDTLTEAQKYKRRIVNRN